MLFFLYKTKRAEPITGPALFVCSVLCVLGLHQDLPLVVDFSPQLFHEAVTAAAGVSIVHQLEIGVLVFGQPLVLGVGPVDLQHIMPKNAQLRVSPFLDAEKLLAERLNEDRRSRAHCGYCAYPFRDFFKYC